jgi:hypothetical protein
VPLVYCGIYMKRFAWIKQNFKVNNLVTGGTLGEQITVSVGLSGR